MTINIEPSALISTATKIGLRLSFVIAGGAAGLFELFKIPGCSKVLTEARMLYSEDSFTRFLAKPLSVGYVSQETAELLALKMDELSEADICFAVTSALSTNRKRRGENHGYLAISRNKVIEFRQHIIVPTTDRASQDAFLTKTVTEFVANYITQL